MKHAITAINILTGRKIKNYQKYLNNEQLKKVKESAKVGTTRIYFINKKPYQVITDL